MTNITIFTDAWNPQINGVVTTLKTTVEHLEKREYDVKVIHPGLFKMTIPLQPSTGIYMPLLPMGIADDEVKNADHIHIATEGSIGLAARYYCKKYKKKYTTSFHTKYPEYLYEHAYIPPRVTSRYFRWFHRNSHCVMVPTPAMVDYCSEIGIKNVKVWSRGVDTSLFKPDPKFIKPKKVIRSVYVGRVSAEKNLIEYLEVTNPNIVKYVIGDGPQLDEYKQKYTDACFLGRKSHEEIATLLQTFDVFAWPSLTDTFGLVVLEAMACGLPVAAFDNEVNRYIIENGKSGILTDSYHFEEAIIKASKLNEFDALTRARQFSWEAATDQFVENLV
jgi:glycosyltransferase involved in cell wall biosynthesis